MHRIIHSMDIPERLYYVTVQFADGRQVTPSYFVFDALPEGVSMIRRYYDEAKDSVESFIVKELKFIETKVLPDDAYIILPHTDGTIVEEGNPEEHEQMVALAEIGDPSESIMAILPEEQDAEDLLCRAFYMGPFRKAESVEGYISGLIEDPFIAATPLDYVWLYRPTGEMKAVKL